jgi:hypothetical protein
VTAASPARLVGVTASAADIIGSTVQGNGGRAFPTEPR